MDEEVRLLDPVDLVEDVVVFDSMDPLRLSFGAAPKRTSADAVARLAAAKDLEVLLCDLGGSQTTKVLTSSSGLTGESFSSTTTLTSSPSTTCMTGGRGVWTVWTGLSAMDLTRDIMASILTAKEVSSDRNF